MTVDVFNAYRRVIEGGFGSVDVICGLNLIDSIDGIFLVSGCEAITVDC